MVIMTAIVLIIVYFLIGISISRLWSLAIDDEHLSAISIFWPIVLIVVLCRM